MFPAIHNHYKNYLQHIITTIAKVSFHALLIVSTHAVRVWDYVESFLHNSTVIPATCQLPWVKAHHISDTKLIYNPVCVCLCVVWVSVSVFLFAELLFFILIYFIFIMKHLQVHNMMYFVYGNKFTMKNIFCHLSNAACKTLKLATPLSIGICQVSTWNFRHARSLIHCIVANFQCFCRWHETGL